MYYTFCNISTFEHLYLTTNTYVLKPNYIHTNFSVRTATSAWPAQNLSFIASLPPSRCKKLRYLCFLLSTDCFLQAQFR